MRDVSRSKVAISHLSKHISCLQISPQQTNSERRWEMSVTPKLEFPISSNWSLAFRYLLYIQIQTGDERCQSLQSWNFPSHFQSLCQNFLLEKNKMRLSTVTMSCAQNLITPSAYKICNHCVTFLERMRLRSVCPCLNLYRQSHLSPVPMSCVQNRHTICTPISHTICNPCVAIFFGEDEIEICLSFSECV